jgi:hypothetical protein
LSRKSRISEKVRRPGSIPAGEKGKPGLPRPSLGTL